VASFDEVVPPGQAGSIKVSIHTANYKGPIGKGITVTHDDTTQGPIMLSVKANVVGSAVVFPYPSLTLAPRMKGFKEPALLLIRRDETEKGTLDVTGLTASVPWLKTTLRKVAAPEAAVEGLPAAIPGDYVISVLVDHAPVGSTAQSITFKTGLTRESQMTIPVMVTVRASVVATSELPATSVYVVVTAGTTSSVPAAATAIPSSVTTSASEVLQPSVAAAPSSAPAVVAFAPASPPCTLVDSACSKSPAASSWKNAFCSASSTAPCARVTSRTASPRAARSTALRAEVLACVADACASAARSIASRLPPATPAAMAAE